MTFQGLIPYVILDGMTVSVNDRKNWLPVFSTFADSPTFIILQDPRLSFSRTLLRKLDFSTTTMSALQEEEETCPPQPASKISPFVLKLGSAPTDYFFQLPNASPPIDLFAAPTGPYFFYGTLSDPSLLAEILNLDHEPKLCPAHIMGYKTKLWAQYPALIDARGEVVEDVVHHVRIVGDAERLAGYETGRYRAKACLVRYGWSEAGEGFGVYLYVCGGFG